MKALIMTLIIYLLSLNSVNAALPDPTRPPQFFSSPTVKRESPKQADEFRVNAIRVSDADRSAIVNGRIVRVGESVGSAVVIDINLQEVILEYQARVISIPLFTGTINKIYKTSVDED